MREGQLGALRATAGSVPSEVLRFAAGMVVVVLNCADVVTTRMLLDRGGTELNPAASWLIREGSLAPTKVAAAGLVAVLLLLVPPRRWVRSAVLAVVVTYLAIVASNSLQLGLS